MTEEDEEFNRIERESAMRQESVRATVKTEQPAQQEPVTDEENEKFSRDVSGFKGADPEATKYALEEFLRNRVPAIGDIRALKHRIHALEGDVIGYKQLLDAAEQPAQQEPVAWPCVIAEADFEQNTITLEMQCSDYKIGAGQHWLSTFSPQRTWKS